MMRESASQEGAQAAFRAIGEFDVAGLLSEVRSPTLVLHRRQAPVPGVDVVRSLASRIPNARLVLLEGSSLAPFLEDTDAVLKATDEFLSEGEEAGEAAAPLAKEDVHTILITDMEGSTTLTQRLGDAKAQDVLRTHNAILRDALKAHNGSEIKHTGDGIMASFASASRALECAIAMQRAFAQHNESNPDVPIRVRIGVNAGEPVAEEEDLFGTAVQLAARICAHAEPGQILVPIVVRELAAGKKFLFADLGETVLRGFEDPVRLFEVRWRD
jgi:class 3 adenylate cyclase